MCGCGQRAVSLAKWRADRETDGQGYRLGGRQVRVVADKREAMTRTKQAGGESGRQACGNRLGNR